MSKRGSNPNTAENTHPYPHKLPHAKMREDSDGGPGKMEHNDQHEADLAKLDRGEGSEKGGR